MVEFVVMGLAAVFAASSCSWARGRCEDGGSEPLILAASTFSRMLARSMGGISVRSRYRPAWVG